jgi:hypothetical protein
VVWGYQLLDFEESLDDHEDEEFTTICSNDYTDDKEMNDIIDASNLNQSTVHRLCRFLFGASSQSKQVCDDFSFLRLLFGSMGTFHSVSLMMEGWIGYSWKIPDNHPHYASLHKKMIEDGVIDEDDDDDPEIFWLEHSMRQAAGALRPIDNYYVFHTSIRDNAPSGDCSRSFAFDASERKPAAIDEGDYGLEAKKAIKRSL